VNWYQDFIFSTIMKLPGVESIQSIVTLSEMKCSTAVSLRQLAKR
jgi:Lrp/AsnC family transcriptional regulator